jgi:ATP-dependent RNA helicase MSS116
VGQVVIGGTNMRSEIQRLRSRVPDILVATPGRCLDHLTTDESNLQAAVRDTRVLVCDEADNLLDMG